MTLLFSGVLEYDFGLNLGYLQQATNDGEKYQMCSARGRNSDDITPRVVLGKKGIGPVASGSPFQSFLRK